MNGQFQYVGNPISSLAVHSIRPDYTTICGTLTVAKNGRTIHLVQVNLPVTCKHCLR